MTILVTGGAGYIGSHTCVELLNSGYEVVVIDNLSNSDRDVIDRIVKITNKKIDFYVEDVMNGDVLEHIFKTHNIDAVIHFAGLKAVGESVENPIQYYYTNITSTMVLCDTMKKYNVKNLVFSSSATVYGNPKELPIKEDSPLFTTNPYGSTKLIIENILRDIYTSDNEWNISVLRYFNPIGAHKSGLIGENPKGIPNNLMPYISQVAEGRRDKVTIFGDDYATCDGTGERDYIHVVDLAKGHIKALEKLSMGIGVSIYNLGTGRGYTVLEMIEAFKRVNDVEVPYVVGTRRAGDIASCYADTSKAEKELEWKAEKTLEDMCIDTWRWQQNSSERSKSLSNLQSS